MLIRITRADILFCILCFMYLKQSTSSLQVNLSPGHACIFCTVGVGLIEQLGQVHNESVSAILQRVCALLPPSSFRQACEQLLQFVGPTLIDLFYLRYTPDVICTTLKVCQRSENGRTPKCHLFPRPTSLEMEDVFAGEKIVKKHLSNLEEFDSACDWPGAKLFCNVFNNRYSKRHKPLIDLDGDGFSTQETFRGSSWRGKDCSDRRASFRPGAKPLNDDVESDSNCNGIYGVDRETGRPYEKLFCENSEPRGLMIIGDSAGAHFHIPEQWFDARHLSTDILTHLPYVLSNELDWPMASFTTGYRNVTWPIVEGYTVSVYDFLKQRNLCNHRDYHNLGVNGARTGDPPSYLGRTVRNQTSDHPLLLFYAFVGNDVCNPHNDTLAHMTTPEQLRKNVLQTLYELDGLLPHDSHILMTGLANGSVLWDALHTRFHPLGGLNRDIRYPEFYEFLSCVEENPCGGWMTSNDTLRMLTTQRAMELSKVIREIAKEYKHAFEHFDVEYLDCPFTEIVEEWEKEHPGKLWQLIESVDGFHPNQLANNLIAKYVWRYMEENIPHFVGKVNPNNLRISETFGDQGGY